MSSTTPASALEWVRRYVAHLGARGYSRSTLNARLSSLARLLSWFRGDLTEVTESVLEGFLIHEGTRPNELYKRRCLTQNSLDNARAALRGFFGFLLRQRVLLHNPAQAIHYAVQPGHRHAPTQEAVLLLLGAPGRDALGLRDRAIMEMLYSTGIRCGELCKLSLGDVDMAQGVVFVKEGKGGKDRMVPIGRVALKALTVYLRTVRPALRPITDAVFVGHRGHRFTREEVEIRLRRYCEALHIEPRITPHHLRHACATTCCKMARASGTCKPCLDTRASAPHSSIRT